MSWEWKESVLSSRVRRYQPQLNQTPTTWHKVLDSWCQRDSRALSFINLLQQAPFAAYRWETPGIIKDRLSTAFEFVLVDAPEINVPANSAAFRDHFSPSKQTVTFRNLGRDALLVVPCPDSRETQFGHLSQFMQTANTGQILDLWCTVAEKMLQQVSSTPIWLSTAGGGVPWLHVRFDSKPKYYHHQPYKRGP